MTAGQHMEYVRKGNTLVRASVANGKPNRAADVPGRAATPPLPPSRASTPPLGGIWSNSRPNSRPSTPPRGVFSSRPLTPPLGSPERSTDLPSHPFLVQLSNAPGAGHRIYTSSRRLVENAFSTSMKAGEETISPIHSPPRAVEYKKSKANQLIATNIDTSAARSGSSSAGATTGEVSQPQSLFKSMNFVTGASKDQAGHSQSGYFKKGKNQIVRGQPGSPILRSSNVHTIDGSVRSGLLLPPTAFELRPLAGLAAPTRLQRVLSKSLPLRRSGVWKLGTATTNQQQSIVKGVSRKSPFRLSVLPWKRTPFTPSSSLPKVRSSPFGNRTMHGFWRRRLEKQRNMEALYTRSGDGFSLRRSGVRSIAGSSITWTKSADEKMKQASKEATQVMAAVSKKRREKKEAAADMTMVKAEKLKVQHTKPRARIVTVGLLRYKMDASGRTLQRLPDSPGALAAPELPVMGTPRRASIGGTSYVRVGSGNQLVRDPKAASKALASERVRYSLHNARVRKAKPKGYCQFFTRFGKCKKKDSGQCPYIHDPDKVAVCTKFLKGNCTTPNCPLTHKVAAARMPDCSYFLQVRIAGLQSGRATLLLVGRGGIGLCTNESCPYRHVNVNSNAAVCDAFLKGYCEQGDACDKKHTYICPAYAASGECDEGPKCHMLHPKVRQTKKHGGIGERAQRKEEGNRGRYFKGAASTEQATKRKEKRKREDGVGRKNVKKRAMVHVDLGDGGILLGDSSEDEGEENEGSADDDVVEIRKSESAMEGMASEFIEL